MARTVSDIIIDAPAAAVMSVIADFENYPMWATGMQVIEISAETNDGRPTQVRFNLDSPPIRDTFALRYLWQGDDHVSWCLVPESETMLTAMDGSYTLDAVAGGRTRVTYHLSVDLKLPILGMLKRKAEKVIVDSALRGLKKRVENQTGA